MVSQSLFVPFTLSVSQNFIINLIPGFSKHRLLYFDIPVYLSLANIDCKNDSVIFPDIDKSYCVDDELFNTFYKDIVVVESSNKCSVKSIHLVSSVYSKFLLVTSVNGVHLDQHFGSYLIYSQR